MQKVDNELEEKKEPKLKKVAEAADGLSLGISMVVAVLLGVAIGLGLKNVTDAAWTFWIGVFIGVAAAILNVYKAYSRQKKSLDELANDPKYNHKRDLMQKAEDDEDEDEKY